MTSIPGETVVRVGISEGSLVRKPDVIRTTGLGSCVGVVIYDAFLGIGGLVHVMLPQAPADGEFTRTKYADSGIDWLYAELLAAGCVPSRFRAKIAGGAQMFANIGKSDTLKVGPRNVEAVEQALQIHAIPIVAADVGGNVGRTIEFDVSSEQLFIRTALRGTYTI